MVGIYSMWVVSRFSGPFLSSAVKAPVQSVAAPDSPTLITGTWLSVSHTRWRHQHRGNPTGMPPSGSALSSRQTVPSTGTVRTNSIGSLRFPGTSPDHLLVSSPTQSAFKYKSMLFRLPLSNRRDIYRSIAYRMVWLYT